MPREFPRSPSRIPSAAGPGLVLTCSGILGFVVVYAGLRGGRSAGNTVLAEAGVDRPLPSITGIPDKAGAGLPASGRESGFVLAAQIRTTLNLFGIDSQWAETLAAADASGFPDLVEKMKSLSGHHQGKLMEILRGRWAQLDPMGGVEFFKSKKSEENLTGFFKQWQRIDFAAAAASAGELSDKFLRRTLRDKALLDPKGLLAWLLDRPDLNPLTLFNSGGEENIEALKELTKADPDRMLAWTRQVPEDKWDMGFISNFAGLLAERSPDDAVAWAKSLKDPGRSSAGLAGVAKALAASHPDRALSLMAEMPAPDSDETRQLQYEVIKELDWKDSDRIPALAQPLPKGGLKSQILQKAIYSLMGSDPAKAFSLADTLGLEVGSTGALWVPKSVKNPAAARSLLEVAGQAADSTFREEMTKGALLGWMEKDPVSLAAYLKDRINTPLLASMRAELQKGLAVQKLRDGKADPELTAMIGLPVEALASMSMEGSPAKAAALLMNIGDAEARQRATRDIVRNYVWHDRVEATAWSEYLPDADVQSAAWKEIAADWVKEDSWQASQWIAKLPAGPGRDNAVLAMTGEIRKSDPDLAWKWALSMNDPTLKNEALAATAESWRQKDSSALSLALKEADLSPEARQAVLTKLQTGSGK